MTEQGKAPAARTDPLTRIRLAAEAFFQHHGHHPDESCCDACGPLKDAIWDALNGRNGDAVWQSFLSLHAIGCLCDKCLPPPPPDSKG